MSLPNGEETLGDILGRALRGDFNQPLDDAMDATTVDAPAYVWPVLDADGEVVGEREVSGAEWGRNMSSWRAAFAIAEHYDLAFEDVRSVMRRVPENLTVLLDSREGWSVLGEQIAITITGHLPDGAMLPTVH